jgi:hypothetical protein
MTVAATLDAKITPLDVGQVISATIRTLGRRWLALLLIGLPFVCVPVVLSSFALPEDRAVANLLANLPYLVFIGAATMIAYSDIRGEGLIGAPAAIGAALRRFGSLFLVSFISSLATVLGLVLLIAPGLVLCAIFSTGASAVMIEQMNSSHALQRAWDLSRGSRWRLVALLAVAVTAFFVLALALGLVVALAEIAPGNIGATFSAYVATPLMVLILLEITTVGSVAAYAGLRRAREGAGELAGAFD